MSLRNFLLTSTDLLELPLYPWSENFQNPSKELVNRIKSHNKKTIRHKCKPGDWGRRGGKVGPILFVCFLNREKSNPANEMAKAAPSWSTNTFTSLLCLVIIMIEPQVFKFWSRNRSSLNYIYKFRFFNQKARLWWSSKRTKTLIFIYFP